MHNIETELTRLDDDERELLLNELDAFSSSLADAESKIPYIALRRNIEEGKIDRRSGPIIILDQDGSTEVGRYNFYHAWPCKWFVPDMDASGSNMAIEKIELAVEKVERA